LFFRKQLLIFFAKTKSMSFNQFSQSLEEMHIMQQFRNSYAEFPKGKLLKTESPDFVVKQSIKASIGIELTKLHGPTVLKHKTHYPQKINDYQPPELNFENIDFTIHSKNEKLGIYQRQKLNQIWLLITTDLAESPVSFNLSNKLENWNFISGFQKVFMFELKSRKVFELNISV
jgi:hypothetical protein